MFRSHRGDRTLLRLVVDIAHPIKWLCNYDDIFLCPFARATSSVDKEPSAIISHGFGRPWSSTGNLSDWRAPSAWLEADLEENHAYILTSLSSHWNDSARQSEKTMLWLRTKSEKAFHLTNAFYMSSFMIFFNPLWLQISGSKFQNNNLSSWTNFQSLYSFQGKLQTLAFRFNKCHCPWLSLIFGRVVRRKESPDERGRNGRLWIQVTIAPIYIHSSPVHQCTCTVNNRASGRYSSCHFLTLLLLIHFDPVFLWALGFSLDLALALWAP